MGNINNSLSHCEFDLFDNYELDWLSEKTWNIETNLSNDEYKIEKGNLEINTNKLFKINLKKNIDNLKEIKTLKINYNFEYNLKENFYFNFYLNNKNNSIKLNIDKLVLNNNNLIYLKQNTNYNLELIDNKFKLEYNLNFKNVGILQIKKNIIDSNIKEQRIFNIDYKEPIFINIEIYNKNFNNESNYFKLNI